MRGCSEEKAEEKMRTFAERMRAAPIEYKAMYGKLPDYIDQYWFALCGRCPTVEERKRIEEAGLIGKK